MRASIAKPSQISHHYERHLRYDAQDYRDLLAMNNASY